MEIAADHPASIEDWFADVVVDGDRGEHESILTYRVPDAMRGALRVGSVVWVAVRKRWAIAVVVAVHGEEPPFLTRDILALPEPPFALSPAQIETGLWLARETACPRFDALAPFFPPGLTRQPEEILSLVDPGVDLSPLTPAQAKLARLLVARGALPLETARAELRTALTTVVPALEDAGVLIRTPRVKPMVSSPPRGVKWARLVRRPEPGELDRAAKQRAVADYFEQLARLRGDGATIEQPLARVLSRTGASASAIEGLRERGILELVLYPDGDDPADDAAPPAPVLTPAQAAAREMLERALRERDSRPFLLHGVTGSGKTEVYLRAAAWCLRHNRGVILLVPEITLASQVVRRVRARFPGRVAVLHSALSDGERAESWQRIARGDAPIVVGARSALFAPLADIGLIVLDEEHETAYKQDSEPRYHARALAEQLARQHGAVLVLGSATPAVETAWRARAGDIDELSLPARVGPALSDGDTIVRGQALELPPVEIVDLRLELHRGNTGMFSEAMLAMMERVLRAREQAILLLNRRGLATIVLCRSCGRSLICPFCEIPLVYHGDLGLLLCHRCDYRERPPERCPTCNGGLNYFGAGTQRVESEVARLFPRARVLRWDQDVVRRKGSHETLLRRVERHEVDFVVGTQMIAKGLDLPLVTGIGVINADTMLHLPDFRSGERTFQLLTQVAGRAGRRGPGGQVIVQSYTPGHYAVVSAAKHDYDAFFAEEIDFRRTHQYPPFTRLARYAVRDTSETRCAERADQLARQLALHARSRGVEMDLLGPAPAFVAKVRGMHQWQVVLRSTNLEALLDGLPAPPGWMVDIDPLSML